MLCASVPVQHLCITYQPSQYVGKVARTHPESTEESRVARIRVVSESLQDSGREQEILVKFMQTCNLHDMLRQWKARSLETKLSEWPNNLLGNAGLQAGFSIYW